MLWLTIGLALLAAAVAVVYVARPLFAPARPLHETDDSPVGELMARKDTVLNNIKEIEFDYRTGKLNEEDYTRYNHRLRQQALSLIKRIDQLAPEVGDLEAELEAAIASQRVIIDNRPVAVPAAGAAMITAAAPVAAPAAAPSNGRFCHQCGAAVAPEDNFCGACGTKLRENVPA
jgi:hypothetical protein